MNDGEILLRAICALPDDDAPRLAYADWLDENNDPRQAEFIRIQIELHRLPLAERDAHPLHQREVALWRELKKWRYVLGDWLRMSLSGFERGFNTYWNGTAQDILRDGANFWRLGPVNTVHFSVHSKIDRSAEAGAALGACPILANFRVVSIDGRGLTDAWLRALLESPHITKWQRLMLISNHLTDTACEALADCVLMKSSCRLQVVSTATTPAGQALIEWPEDRANP